LTIFIALAGCTSSAVTPPSPPTQATTPAGRSITLVNQGFESSEPGILGAPAGWFAFQHAGPPSYAFTLDTGTAHSGSRSLRIDSVGPEIYGAIVQRVPATAYRGRTLRYSVWMKTRAVAGHGPGTGAGPTMQPYAGGYPVGGIEFADALLSGTHDWTRLEVSLAVPPNADSLEIGVKLGGRGSVWLDDAELGLADAR
jgi:hypothetical protein